MITVFSELYKAKPIKVVDEKSATDRINQWKEQESCFEKIQIATESFNLLHLVSLVQIYDDLTKLGEKLKSDPKSNVKNVKSWTCMCRYSKRHHDEFSLPQKI